MARTAPVPNFAAIPGMNPGLFVMGGGGDGGGSGAGKGKGGKGKQGADGKNGGKDAQGGGKGAGSCGAGSGAGKCPTHNAKTAAGDPVDLATGRVYTTPEADLYLPGLIPLTLLRSYRSSDDPPDVGLGAGWSCTLSWRIEERRRSVLITTDDATRVLMDRPDDGETVLGMEGWELRREGAAYVLVTTEDAGERSLWFVPHPSEPALFLLSAIKDKNDNRIELRYDARGLLEEVLDSVGRSIRVRQTYEGRIAAFEVKNAAVQGRWIAFASYTYDDGGDLVAVTDADGVTVQYTYEDHRMTSQRFADGLVFHFRYDDAGRCIETWGERPGGDEGLADSVPAVLADGVTRARGIHHVRIEYLGDGYVEAIDSVRVRRVQNNQHGKADLSDHGGSPTTWEYDDYGNPIRHVDPEGGETVMERDRRGFLVKLRDPLGRTTELIRDDKGLVIEVRGPDGTSMTAERNPAGNIMAVTDAAGRTSSYVRRPNGLVVEKIEPSGARYAYEYDHHMNLIAITDPLGARYQFGYDELGRTTHYRSPTGAVTRFAYTDLGRPVLVVWPNGGQYRLSRDVCGRVEYKVDPDGRVSRARYGGYGKICATVEPDGRERHLKYNREGWLVEVHNARGEVWRYEHDTRGEIVTEHTFDGRVIHYRRDAMGRVVKADRGDGQWIELVYDAVGQLACEKYEDGTEDKYTYNDDGYLIHVSSPEVEIDLHRDAVNRIQREVMHFDGKTYAIDRAFGLADEWVSRTVSTGHRVDVKRDALGNVIESVLDGTERLSHVRDAIGRETARMLPGQALLGFGYNELSRLVGYEVRRATTAGAVPPGQPAWLGDDPNVLFQRRFQLSPSGLIAGDWDAARGATTYGRDAAGRVVEHASPQRGPFERLAYDDVDNVYEANQNNRAYGPGNRLLRHGAAELFWNDAGQLVERRVVDGADVRVWRYEWNARGHLAAVSRPDGARVEMTYDSFSRRLMKRVLVRDDAGRLVEKEKVHFVWNRDELLQEIRHRAAEAGDPVVLERSYYFDPGDKLLPVAHQDVQRAAGGATAGGWVHYLNDPSGTPEHLVSDIGHMMWSRRQTLLGATDTVTPQGADTPIRSRGQYEDEETGLAYNRHRYFDPELGCFLSADPIDLEGRLNVYGSDPDALDFPDFFGLDPHTCDAKIVKADGSTVNLGSFDSQQSGPAWNALLADKSQPWADKVATAGAAKTKAEKKSASGLYSLLSHTEKKICTAAKNAGITKNDKLVIDKATLPPCTTCQAYMKDLVNSGKCGSVEYNYTEGGKQKQWTYP